MLRTAIGPQHPEITLYINGRAFSGLLDVGSHMSVIIDSQWPYKWPKIVTITQLQGIVQMQNPEQCSNELAEMRKVIKAHFSYSLFLIYQ